MKRILFLGAVLLLVASSVLAGGTNFFYQSSGTTDYGLKFGSKAQGFAVMAATEDISIYACMGSTPVDTIYVMGGSSMSVYCPCDSLRVDRTSATKVYVNPTYNTSIFPSMSINQGELAGYLDGPTPVTVSVSPVISDLTMKKTSHQTYPVEGIPVDGAHAVLVTFDWDRFTAADTSGFAWSPVFGASASDSGVTNLTKAGALDTYTVDVLKVADTVSATGSISQLITLPDGGMFSGYMFIRIYPWASNNVDGLNAVARVVY